MKPANQTKQEENLSEFDKRMVQEMKKIPELHNWREQQFAEYCSILKCYSMLIVSSTLNERQNSEESSALTVISLQLKQAA